MKKFIMLALLSISSFTHAGNIIANGTRFIYPSNEKEITIQLTNTAHRPALVQSWLDTGNPDTSPDDISTPFTITPPVAKVNSHSGQTLRIRNIDKTALPKDKESLFWLNILEIPPSVSVKGEGKNALLMAIRSRFKFIYRPEGLGNVDKAPDQLVINAKGKTLTVNNPTPFYITITTFAKENKHSLNKETVMVAPKQTRYVTVSESVNQNEKLTITTINDFGSDAEYTITAK